MHPFRCVILAIIVNVSYVLTASFDEEDGRLWQWPTPTADRLNEVIEQGDYPERLAGQITDGYLANIPSNFKVLWKMIELNRNRSFQFVLSDINFHPQLSDADKTRLLQFALEAQRSDICDFLLSQNFAIIKSVFSFWHSPLSWKVEDMKSLISKHPEKVPEFAPSWFLVQLSQTLEKALFIIEFNRHCTTINSAFAENQRFEPTTLIGYVLHNGYFEDSDMAYALRHLIDSGAYVSKKMYDDFVEDYPRYEQTKSMLFYAFNEDVKEPE